MDDGERELADGGGGGETNGDGEVKKSKVEKEWYKERI